MSNISKNDLDLINRVYFQQVDSLACLRDLDDSDLESICQSLSEYLKDVRSRVLSRYNLARKYPDGLEFTLPAGLVGSTNETALILSGYPSDSITLSELRKNGCLGVNCGQTSLEGVAYLCQMSGVAFPVSLPQETITKCIQNNKLGD